MQIHRDSRGYPSYFCPNTRSKRCSTGWHSTLRSDPQLDEQLETLLGDLETLNRLIDASAEEAARRAQAPPSELARRITDLENQKRRVKDAYVEGAFDLEEMRKRLAGIEGELAVLHDVLERQNEEIEVDPALVDGIVDVFGSWRDLSRSQKREMLRSFGMRVLVVRPDEGPRPPKRHRLLKVSQVVIGILADARIYKKMQRLGIT